MKTRIYFLDNLRTFLIFLVVVLHSGLVYEHVLENSWIVDDPVKCNNIGLIRMYLDLFVMFSIFFISGYFVRYSVKSKTAWDFVKSKFKRIMIPWAVAVFTLIPAYKAIFLYSRGLPQEEWFSYFHFFERAGSDLSFYANNPAQNWLWFLPVLFLFQLVYLRLSKINWLSINISIRTAVLLTFGLGVITSVIISFNGLTGWTDTIVLHFQNERLLVYFMAFLLGSLCNKLNVFETSKKNINLYIWSNVVLTISLVIFTVVALNLFFNLITPNRNYFFFSESIDKVLYYASAISSMLSFLYVLIHIFRFNFNKINPIMKQLNKSSYSVYIVHVIVIGVIATAMLPLSISAFIKFLILATSSFVVSNLIVYSYQMAKIKTVNYKTVITVIILISLVFSAFKGNVGNIDNAVQSSTTEQVAEPQQNINIHAAVISGNLTAVKQLLASGTDVDEPEPAGGSSPLISAIVFGQTEIAKALINAGADVNFKNNEGSTPLHTAAFFCDTEVVKMLLQHGADKSVKNNAGSIAAQTVSGPFESVKGIYDYFSKVYAPLGLKLDYEQIKATRPVIAKMLN